MIEHEIQPWIVAIEGNQLALWQIDQPPAAALALFSDRDKAELYASQLATARRDVIQPSRRELLGLMIKCYQEQIQFAVLDPNTQSASRIFNLRDVLRAARETPLEC